MIYLIVFFINLFIDLIDSLDSFYLKLVRPSVLLWHKDTHAMGEVRIRWMQTATLPCMHLLTCL
jgi:hypothetical protein